MVGRSNIRRCSDPNPADWKEKVLCTFRFLVENSEELLKRNNHNEEKWITIWEIQNKILAKWIQHQSKIITIPDLWFTLSLAYLASMCPSLFWRESDFTQVSNLFNLPHRKRSYSPTPRKDLVGLKVPPAPLTVAGSEIGMGAIQVYDNKGDTLGDL